MKKLIQFFKDKPLLKHILLFVVLFLVVLQLVMFALSKYTRHGQTIPVPDLSGLSTNEANKKLATVLLKSVVIDSVYQPKSEKGIVLHQEPQPGIAVKENRTIYLYISTVLPPQVVMPKLKDKSLKQATTLLQTYGLKLGHLKFVPDQCVNCVLDQKVKGKKIEAGTSLPKGTVIDLVVGKGLSDERVLVPDLKGLTRAQALAKLAEYSLNEGALNYDSPKDSLHQRVYRQIPAPTAEESVSMGSIIDLFFAPAYDK